MIDRPELFPYQEEGAIWLSLSRLALLADDMGLGKSAQAITACDLTHSNRILVLTPAAARVNWHREFLRFSPTPREFTIFNSKKVSIPDNHSVISSYDLAGHIPSSEHFDALILDEAHYLKSPTAKRAFHVFGTTGLCRRVKWVWALTGTPMPNNPSELWILLHSFGRTPLKFDAFVEKYCTYYEAQHGRTITGMKSQMAGELKELLAPIMLRRRKEDVLRDLPPIHFTHQVVEPGDVDLEVTSSFIQYVFPTDRRKELAKELSDQENLIKTVFKGMGGFTSQAIRPESMKALEAMAKSVSTLRRYTGLQKLQPAGDLVEEELMFGAYEKIVIFAIHRDVIEGLRRRLNRYKAVTLYGNTPDDKRDANIDRFQKDPKCRVFIGNIHSAGVAITLTSAHQVLFVEQSWTPADNAQAAMRCHRIGQTMPVTVRVLGVADSIDEKVSAVLKTKMKQIAQVFDVDDKMLMPDERHRMRFLDKPFEVIDG